MVEDQNTSEAMDEVKRISIEGIGSLLTFIKDQNPDYALEPVHNLLVRITMKASTTI